MKATRKKSPILSNSLKNSLLKGSLSQQKMSNHIKPCLKIQVLQNLSPQQASFPEVGHFALKNQLLKRKSLKKTESLKYSLSPCANSKKSSPKFQNSPKSLNNYPFHILKQLTKFELEEIFDYKKVYFAGNLKNKIQTSSDLLNNGFDFESGNYKLIQGDHLAYRYEINKFLGKGSFGSVCECFDHKKKETVAIKILRNKKNFHHQGSIEISLLRAIKDNDPEDCNNLIKIKCYFIFRNHICIVFPLLGMSLYELINNNKISGISMKQMKNITEQILKSVLALEAVSIIHCDIKPENLLFDNDQLKLIDFGSSCYIHERIHMYIQSRFYRSPEVLLGISYDSAIDMWSVGCIVAEMATGKVLLPGCCEEDQLMLIIELLGIPPENLLKTSRKKSMIFSEKGTLKKLSLKDGTEIAPKSKNIECKDSLLTDFIYKCLEWDPEKRIAPKNALNHPWLTIRKKSKSFSLGKPMMRSAKMHAY